MRFCNVTNNRHNVPRRERERKCCNVTGITQRIEWPSPTWFHTGKLILSLRFITIIASAHDDDFSILSVCIFFVAETHGDDRLYSDLLEPSIFYGCIVTYSLSADCIPKILFLSFARFSPRTISSCHCLRDVAGYLDFLFILTRKHHWVASCDIWFMVYK